MGAYYAKFMQPDVNPRLSLVVEQGQEVGRDGRVFVEIETADGQFLVRVGGTAVFVSNMAIETYGAWMRCRSGGEGENDVS